jgi:hypothetical protein
MQGVAIVYELMNVYVMVLVMAELIDVLILSFDQQTLLEDYALDE